MGFLSVTLGHAVPLDQRLARRFAVVRAAVRGSPDPDRKTLARGHALRLAAPGGDLAVLATFFATDTGHAVIVRRPCSCRKWADRAGSGRFVQDRVQGPPGPAQLNAYYD